MKKISIFVLCLSLAFAWTAFAKTSFAAEKTVVVTDMAQRQVEAPFDPERIVCLGPGALRLIVYLQAADKVSGVEDMEKKNPDGRPYWLAKPELAKLPRCGPGGPASINKKPDMEALLACDPDVIFVTYMDAALADSVQKTLGIPTVVISYGLFATFDTKVYDAIRTAAKVLNRHERAEKVVEYIESLRTDLQARIADISEDDKPGVYVGGIGYRGAKGLESTEHRYTPFEWVDAENLALKVESSVDSHVFLDKEKLLELDPDIIFVDGGGMALVEEDYKKKPEFYSALTAFQQGRVHTLYPYNSYTTNIGTAAADAYAIGKILYKDRFQDVDPEKKADEIYTFLVGAPVYKDMEKDYGVLGQAPAFLNQ